MAGTSRQQDRYQATLKSGFAEGWRLSLFGAWQLSCADLTIDVGSNGQRLFALLAVRGACDRSYLSGVLWPDCSDSHAHGNLRATLSRLNRRNLSGLTCSANGVLSLRDVVEVDTTRLIARASAVLDGTSSAPDRSTLAILGGEELLLGWYEDWVLAERERLRRLRLHALEVMSGRLLAAGDAMTALEAALAAVAIEPLRESAHRAVISAHLAQGNRAEALRHLDRLRDLLRKELDVEPSMMICDLLR